MHPHIRILPPLLVLLSLVAACGDSTSPPAPDSLEVVAGDDQTGTVTTTLGADLEVRVLDGSGTAMADVEVSWDVESGDGTVSPATAETDADGRARTAWTLGPSAGTQRVTASVDGVSPVVFDAEAEAASPAEVERSSGSERTGTVAEELPAPLTVTVTDEHGNATPGVSVEWAVVDGEGSVDPARSTTDADGAASTRWTLGTRAGDEHAVRAEVADADLEPIDFRAHAEPGSVAEILLSPDTATLEPGDTLELVATLEDAYENPVTDRAVAWESEHPDVAAASADGRIVARAPGPAPVVARADGRAETAEVTVLASEPPTVDAVEPAVLEAGGTATVTGRGFSPVAGWNEVRVDGAEATVTDATADRLTLELPPRTSFPCRRTQEVSLSLTVPERSAEHHHPFAVARQVTLEPGGSATLVSPDDARCNELTETTDDAAYLFTVFNRTEAPSALSSFRVRGEALGGAATAAAPGAPELLEGAGGGGIGAEPPAGPGGREGLSRTPGPDPTSVGDPSTGPSPDGHYEMLERGRELYERLGPPDLERLRARAAPAAPSAPEEGDTLTVRFPHTNDLCEDFIEIESRVVYSGPEAVVLEDVANPVAGGMDAELRAIGEEFHAEMLPIVEEHFGDPFAMDDALGGTGQVYMVFTDELDRFPGAAAFVSRIDFYPTSECPASNERAIFYGHVPDGADEVDAWHRGIRGTVIHETKHIASNAERFSREAEVMEESWLEESTARIAEELYARQLFGYEHNGNTTYSESVGCELQACSGRPRVMLKHFSALYQYYRNPDLLTPLGPAFSGDGTFYGSGWLLVRWAADHFGGPEAAFFRNLTQETSLSGVDNLTARTGRSLGEMLGAWALSLYLDEQDPERDVLQHPSWNLWDVFEGLNQDRPSTFTSSFPLRGWNLDYGDFDHGLFEVRGGSAAFFTLTGDAGGPQLLELAGSGGGPAPSGLGLSVARIR